MMALGDNIRRLREERWLTQQQKADKLYVSRQTVCRWENGSRCPDLITAKKIATEFGVSLDALISDDDMEDLERISGAGKFIKYKRKVKLQEYQRKILEFLQVLGGVYLSISLILRVRFDMRMPVWSVVLGVCIVAGAFALNRRLVRRMEDL